MERNVGGKINIIQCSEKASVVIDPKEISQKFKLEDKSSIDIPKTCPVTGKIVTVIYSRHYGVISFGGVVCGHCKFNLNRPLLV